MQHSVTLLETFVLILISLTCPGLQILDKIWTRVFWVSRFLVNFLQVNENYLNSIQNQSWYWCQQIITIIIILLNLLSGHTQSFKSGFRVQIIASHFTNCKVNSSYCDYNVVNHEKNAKQFFPKENLVHPYYIFSHIQIISTFYSSIAYYYQKEYCLLQSEFQMINRMQGFKLMYHDSGNTCFYVTIMEYFEHCQYIV